MAGSTQGSAGRGGREPINKAPKVDMAKSSYKAMGGGTVSPEVRAAIKAKMAQGMRPNTTQQPAGKPPAAQSIRPPRAPGVRTFTSSNPKAPKLGPSIPEPKVQGKQSSGTKATNVEIARQRALGERSALGEHGTNPRMDHSSESTTEGWHSSAKLLAQAREAASLAQQGKLGGAHAGGHGISELEMAQGKIPASKLGAIGARISKIAEGEIPLP
jgi:hypothetical protein